MVSLFLAFCTAREVKKPLIFLSSQFKRPTKRRREKCKTKSYWWETKSGVEGAKFTLFPFPPSSITNSTSTSRPSSAFFFSFDFLGHKKTQFFHNSSTILRKEPPFPFPFFLFHPTPPSFSSIRTSWIQLQRVGGRGGEGVWRGEFEKKRGKEGVSAPLWGKVWCVCVWLPLRWNKNRRREKV